ncbi:hypothetical protein SAMN05216571_101414 [Onishia taeanensis]|uniref:Uncharacterized protein n=1 Tax=Onishia taeanensis TaxID=284577 RepID=A0A1G7NHV7_9GAMM|nr:hypothetical protein [Halomonas taeanensis]SDF72820.1 hypothetical protein SAMN05216571_101414 [Halomonas taeanensis]
MAASFKIGVASVTKTIDIHRPGMEPEQFTAEIRVRSLDDQEALDKKLKAAETHNTKHVREDLLALGGIVGADDKPAESSKELLDAVYKDPYAHVALCKAWGEVQRGVSEHVAKN